MRVIAFVTLCVACTKDLSAPGVASVVVSPDTVALYPGQTRALTAIARDTRGDTVAGKTVVWSTSDSLVASISAAGVVSAHGVGTVSVHAIVAGVQGTAQVTVALVPVAQVTVSPSADTLFVGHSTSLAVTARDSAGNVLT